MNDSFRNFAVRTIAVAALSWGLAGCAGLAQRQPAGTSAIPAASIARALAPASRVKNNVRPLDPAGGMIRAITDGGFQGTFAYSANSALSGVKITLSNSGQTNLLNAPTPPGTAPVLYLTVQVSGSQTVDFQAASLEATISSASLTANIPYTLYLYQDGALLGSVSAGEAGLRTHMLKFASPLQDVSIAPGTPLVLELAPPAAAGNIFASNQQNAEQITELFAATDYATSSNLLPNQKYSPNGVALDGSGNLFFGDYSGNVYEATAAGGYSSITSLHILEGPQGLAVDGSENVFVAAVQANAVYELVAAGGYATVQKLAPAFAFDLPIAVALDGSGNVYVSDNNAGAVEEILAAGGYTTVNVLATGFSYPHGIAVDQNGNVFLADTGHNAIVELVAANGYKSTTLGSGFSYPSGVAVDGYGNLFVADNGNSAIKEIVASGGYSTVLTLSQSVEYPYFIAIQYPAVSSPLARRHRRK